MIHEQDFLRRALGACDFEHILFSTPRDLVHDGLYKPLAIPMYSSHFGVVSLSTVMQLMGTRKRQKKRKITVKRVMQSITEAGTDSLQAVVSASGIKELSGKSSVTSSAATEPAPKPAPEPHAACACTSATSEGEEKSEEKSGGGEQPIGVGVASADEVV